MFRVFRKAFVIRFRLVRGGIAVLLARAVHAAIYEHSFLKAGMQSKGLAHRSPQHPRESESGRRPEGVVQIDRLRWEINPDDLFPEKEKPGTPGGLPEMQMHPGTK